MANLDELLGDLNRLEKHSRTTAPFMIMAVILVFGAIAYGSFRLVGLQEDLRDARNALTKTEEEIEKKRDELETVTRAHERSSEELDQTKRELEDVKLERVKAVEDQELLQRQLAELSGNVERRKPAAVTIVLATAEQREKAEQIKDALDIYSNTEVKIVGPREPAPYATEVRYYRYPADMDIAQWILLSLQKDFSLPLSRISFVNDPSVAKQTISIHFSRKASTAVK